jgi:hypothetical protein
MAATMVLQGWASAGSPRWWATCWSAQRLLVPVLAEFVDLGRCRSMR